jgi:hypothetical protein
MTLDAYLARIGQTNAEFAATVGCTTEAVRRWRLGVMPQRRFWRRIEAATNGKVGPTDLIRGAATAA